jgi:outer membrane protein
MKHNTASIACQEGGSMKRGKMVVYICVAFILLAKTSYSSEFNSKIGTFDYNKVLNESEAGKAAIIKITEKAKNLDRIYKKKAAEIEEMKKQLEIEAPILNQEARTERQQNLLRRMSGLQAYRNQSQLELKKLQTDIHNRLRKEILEITDEIGKKQDYFLIMDNRNIFHARRQTDLTEKLIQTYNKAYLKKKPAKQ